MKAALLWLLIEFGGRLPVRVLTVLADAAGTLAWWASPRLRAVTRDHMAHVLGGGPSADDLAARDRAARGCVRAAAHYWADLARYAHLDATHALEEYARFDGLDRLFAAVDAGRGVVMVTAHVGAPEFAIHVASALGLDVLALTQMNESRRVNALLHSARRRHGARFTEASLGGLRLAFEQLRCGRIVAMLVDRDMTGTGRAVPFFGEQTTLPEGPIELARRTGATILPCAVLRQGPGRYHVRIEAPLDLVSGDRDVAALALGAALERIIAAAPAQWFALQPIWSGLPSRPRRSHRGTRMEG